MDEFYQPFEPETEAPSKPKRSASSPLLTVLMVFFSLMFVFCLVVILGKLNDARNEKKNYEQLSEIAGMNNQEDQLLEDEAKEKEAKEKERIAHLVELHDMNPDFAGWISIPDTNINYPVMCTPNDVEYYLHRDFYGEKAAGGVPFLGGGCTSFSSSIIAHGHHMRNGTMFADLMKYMKKDYWETHPTVYYSTLEQNGAYEVMAAFNYDATVSDDPKAVNIYRYAGDLTEEEFNEFMNYVMSHKIYDTGITAEYGDRLLMLSTCAYHTENGRFLVVARQKAAPAEETAK